MIKILKCGEVGKDTIFARNMPTVNVSEIVRSILYDVKMRGDDALKEYTERFDKAKLDSLAVTKEEMDEALASVEPSFLEILKKAAANIRKFHENQKRSGFIINDENGIVLGQKVIPLKRVGLYVPGGTASYPSTVLMDSLPAKIAGCEEVVIVNPPGSDGKISPVIIAAAYDAGEEKIFKLCGAQAIGALAYG
ncbi:MAG: histidinol dehydrogenase, partial [Firmicutes bacterium]|nr:histidinol dehydrogenase [Candidatus Colimorpha enterica]